MFTLSSIALYTFSSCQWGLLAATRRSADPSGMEGYQITMANCQDREDTKKYGGNCRCPCCCTKSRKVILKSRLGPCNNNDCRRNLLPANRPLRSTIVSIILIGAQDPCTECLTKTNNTVNVMQADVKLRHLISEKGKINT